MNTFRERGLGGRWLFRCATVGLFALSFAVSASALDPARTVSQYLHDFWGTERGWPGGAVTAIAQTSDGYLWIGTDKGLVRFDGLNFRQFERADPDPMLIGPVRTLLVDTSDNLWILLQNTIVFRYRNGKFELVRGWSENGTTAMARGVSGAVLLSSLAEGTVTYSDNRFQTLSSAALLADAARVVYSEFPDQKTRPFSWFDRMAVPTSLVISMAQTDDGRIWLGTEGRGLFYVQEARVSSAGLANTKINYLLPSQDSGLWVGTTKGALRWNGQELTSAGIPSSLRNLDVLSIFRDRDSNLWMATSRGLFRYNTSGVSLVSTRNTTGPVSALFEDREGDIWIGSARGLERLRDSAFVAYSLPHLNSQSMGPLHVDSGGRVWIAPIEGGLRWLKEGKSGVVTAGGIANDIVYSISGAGKDDVWVGRQQGGLTHLHYTGNTFTAENYTEADGLAQDRVYAVYRTRDGSVWSGTLNRGVSKLKNGHFTNYAVTDGLAGNTVSSIAESLDGTMWFGTPNGVSGMSQDTWRTYTAKDGMPSEDVNCLLEDSAGILWIGTAEGLAYLSSGRMHVPGGAPESLKAPIFGIEEDKDGRLWIATSDHVLRVSRDKLLSGFLKSVDVRAFDQADGLDSTKGVKRSRSVVSDLPGRIWFSLGGGLSVVDPSRVVNSARAIAQIEALSVDGGPMRVQDNIHIPASPRRITFTYTGLSLATPERVRFKYFLEGFDRSWSEPVANREAVYTNLGAGFYRFRVVASNGDSLWNGSETSLGFEIEPLFWQTRWFWTTCLALILVSVWSVHRYRLYHVTSQFNLRLEERVGERTRIARELHDTLLQSFQGLLLRFQAATNLLPKRPEEAKRGFESAIDQAAKAITESRDAVQGLRSSVTVNNDLALAINTLGEELATSETNQNLAELEVDVEGTPRSLHPILRDEVYRIAGEAVRNAFRHADAKRIEVEIRYDEGQLRVRVRDNGKGIDAKYLNDDERPGHYGLRGMRERAKLLGGKLAVWSELDSGTEVELLIPASRAYEKSIDRRNWWLAGKLTKKDTEAKS